MPDVICVDCGKKGHACFDICFEAGIEQGFDMNDGEDRQQFCNFCPTCGHCCN